MKGFCKTKDWECPFINSDKNKCMKSCKLAETYQNQLMGNQSLQNSEYNIFEGLNYRSGKPHLSSSME